MRSKAKEREDGYKVEHIDFSLLQTGVLDETYEVTAIGYDKGWYANDGIWEVLSIDYIFEGLKDIKKYVWKIRPCSIDQYILRQISIFNNYFTYFLINWLKQWDEEISFKEMPKSDKDISCMSLKEAELKNILFSSCVALGLNLKKAHLERCHFRNCDLGASDFTESILDEVIFENCVLRNICFKDTQFKKVYLVNGKKITKVLKEEDLQCSI